MGYSISLAERLSAEKNFHKKNLPLRKAADRGEFDEDGFYVISGHGTITNKGKGVIKNEYTDEYMYAEDIAEMIKADPRYKPGTSIKLASCLNAVMAKEISLIFKDTIVKGPTNNLVTGVFGTYVENNGSWNSYKNGKLISSEKYGFWDSFF